MKYRVTIDSLKIQASRHDHYTQKSAEQQRRSSLGLGNLAGGGLGNMGMSVNPNQ